jgi:hypothetical protein
VEEVKKLKEIRRKYDIQATRIEWPQEGRYVSVVREGRLSKQGTIVKV